MQTGYYSYSTRRDSSWAETDHAADEIGFREVAPVVVPLPQHAGRTNYDVPTYIRRGIKLTEWPQGT
jgi:hypothetical protein